MFVLLGALALAAEGFTVAGLAPEVLEAAERSHRCAAAWGQAEGSVVTVIDFSLPSTEPRLWVLDLDSEAVLHHELVAHGRNTGEDLATAFSNVEGSRRSSLGVFRTAEVYHGKHGRSLRLDGLEPGFNDRARERAIVMHGADYVSEDFARRHGRLGRSWGCPALAQDVAQQVIDKIAGGTLLFAYYPDEGWLEGSRYLACDLAPGSEGTPVTASTAP